MLVKKQTLKIILLIFLTSSLGFAQNEEAERDDTKIHSTEALQKDLDNFKGNSEEVMQKLQEVMGEEDMKALEEAMANGDQVKVKELTQKLSQSVASGKAGQKGLETMAALALKGFQDLSPTELRTQLESRMAGTLFEPIIKTFPKIMNFLVMILQDKTALPTLFTIPKDRKKLIIFAVLNLVLFIFGKLLKRAQGPKKGVGNTKKLKIQHKPSSFSGLKRWLLLFSLRMGLLAYFYGTEIYPTLLVAKRAFS